LERDIIHQSVFACCLEIVMFSYNSNRPFPWVLEALEIEPFYFYRVIEIILRAEESFSRGVIKHLTMVSNSYFTCMYALLSVKQHIQRANGTIYLI